MCVWGGGEGGVKVKGQLPLMFSSGAGGGGGGGGGEGGQGGQLTKWDPSTY